MKKILLVIICILSCSVIFATEQPITQPKMRLAIMDFTSIDIESNRYLRHTDKKSTDDDSPDIKPEERAMLSQEELRQYAKATIQERIYMRKKAAERLQEKNSLEQRRKDNQRSQVLSTELGRAIIMGADMLSVELGKYYDTFELIDRKTVDESIQEIDFHHSGLVSADSSKRFGQMTGATHLVYGVVDDPKAQENSFSGYGVETNKKSLSLDLVIRVVDIAKNTIVFSTRTTSSSSALRTEHSSHKNTGVHRDLLLQAITQAAEQMHARFAQKSDPPTPVSMPKVAFAPTGPNGESLVAQIEIDGDWSGNTPAEIEMSSGRHTIKLTLDGYEAWEKIVNIRNGMNIAPTLRKK